MPIPVSYLISSPRRLFTAIVLFVILDLSVLIINLWIAAQMAQDAVAINLAGRQRMLSQQTTKTLLLAAHAPDQAQYQAALLELNTAFPLFARTLHAFDQGGETRGGDGKTVSLDAVATPGARSAVDTTLRLVAPLAEILANARPGTQQSADSVRRATVYMVLNNREILKQMNLLTTALEHDSIQRTRELRLIQTVFFLVALANFLVIVLGLVKQYTHVDRDRHHWREMAQHDPLTGLFNRAAFREAVMAALDNAGQSALPFCVLMLDLDGFKPINDRFGHAEGDRLLVKLAERLAATARESDVIARLGGDEFAILCPHLHTEDHIHQFCDRVLQAIGQSGCDGSHDCRITASIGVAIYPEHGANTDELLAAADRAMYAIKRAGGGQWKLAELDR